MKKLVISLVLGASLAIVPSAFALKAMTADSMKDTTGQAGVSIAVDDVVIFNSAGTTTYIDSNGYGNPDPTAPSGMGAGFVIKGEESFTTLRGITDLTDRGGYLKFAYGQKMLDAGIKNIYPGGGMDLLAAVKGYSVGVMTAGFIARPLSIDVSGALATLSAGRSFNTGSAVAEAGVVIGLPTLEISKVASTKTYAIAATGSVNDGAEYITVTKSASVTAILGGKVEIAPH